MLLNMLNGYGLASALIQQRRGRPSAQIRQLFGMLILLNVALGAAQFVARPARRGLLPPADRRRSAARAGAALSRDAVHRAPLCAARRRDGFPQAGAGQPRLASLAGAGAALGGALAGWACGRWCSRRSCCSRTRAIGMTLRGALAGVAELRLSRRRRHRALWRGDGGGPALLVPAEPGRRVHRRAPFHPARRWASIRPACSSRRSSSRSSCRRSTKSPSPPMRGCRTIAPRSAAAFVEVGADHHGRRPALLSRARGDRRAAGADGARARNGARRRRSSICSRWPCRS